MSIEINEQLNLSKPSLLYPQYRHKKATIIEGTSNMTITSGGQTNTFEIVNGVLNLAKSILVYTIEPTFLLDNSTYTPADVLSHISMIELLDRKGTVINRTTDLPNLTRVCWKAETSIDKLLSYPVHDSQLGNGNYLRANNNVKTAAAAGTMSLRYNATVAERDYIEPKYCVQSAAAGANPYVPANNLKLNYAIDLEMLYNTIFAEDKDLYFNDTLLFKITWAPNNRSFWTATDSTSPSAGAAAYTVAAGAAVSNLALYVAYEKNQDIINSVISKFKSGGIELLYDHVTSFKRQLSSTAQSQSIKLNKTHGISLKRIYYSVFNSVETSNTMFDNGNVTQKVVSFNTSLDNLKLQDYTINCGSLDYALMRDNLKGSSIMSQGVYNYNWFWCDRFDDSETPLCAKNKENSQGLDLSIERDYSFEATTADAAYNHYVFAVCQKLLKITPEGIMVI